MPSTIAIHGSDGEVLAPFGSKDTFYRGKHQTVRVTAVSTDESDPLIVREALIGLLIPIIFTSEQLTAQNIDLGLVNGSVLAYLRDVINALQEAGKSEAQEVLASLISAELDMFVLPPGSFEFTG